jgi:hypothetical protein
MNKDFIVTISTRQLPEQDCLLRFSTMNPCRGQALAALACKSEHIDVQPPCQADGYMGAGGAPGWRGVSESVTFQNPRSFQKFRMEYF